MDTFLELNRNKLKFTFVRLSLILLGMVSIVLVIAYFANNFPDTQLLLGILLTTGIGFPFFIMFVGYLIWLLNHRARRNAFSKTPFNHIENIGFYKSYLDANSKWSFTDEIKESKMNGFTLIMDISNEKKHSIEVEIPTEWKKLDKREYRRLSEKFKQHNVEFRVGSLVKQYDTKRPTVHNVSDLKKDLELFSELLKQEGFEPKK